MHTHILQLQLRIQPDPARPVSPGGSVRGAHAHLTRSINYHLRVSNKSFTNVLNRKAVGLNCFISDYCVRIPGIFVLNHNFKAFPLRPVLAKAGLHPSFASFVILGRYLRAALPVLLDEVLEFQGLPASNAQWPTLAEASELG